MIALTHFQKGTISFNVLSSYLETICQITFTDIGFVRISCSMDPGFLKLYAYDVSALKNNRTDNNLNIPDYQDYIGEYKYIFSFEPLNYSNMPYPMLISDQISITSML